MFDYKTMNAMGWALSTIIGVVVGVGVIDTLAFPFLIELIPSIGFGALVGFGAKKVIFAVEKPCKLFDGNYILEGKLADAEDKLKIIRTQKHFHKNSVIGNELDDIVDLAHNLLYMLEDNPHKIIAARDFLCYYLDECISMLEQLENMDESKHKIESTRNIEEVLSGMNKAFQKEIERFQKSKAVELDLDIAVLKNELRGKGIK